MATFKDNLKRIREENNLTQAELAKRIGIAAATIGMYETGRREPDFETEEKIADYFNISLDVLRGKKSSDPHSPLFEKIDRLDNVDRIKTEGYVDNLLENDKYKTPVSESVS